MEKALFTLVRLGLGTEQPSQESLHDVACLTGEQWGLIRELAEKQGVQAIVLDGVEQLKAQDCKQTIALPQGLLLEWIGQVMITEQANQQQLEVMNDLSSKWVESGCRVMIMKGQANGVLYPHPNHRSTGDIDCYLFENYAKGNEIARDAGAIVDESWYKHSVISYKGETFEDHQYFVHTRDGKRGKRLNQELVDQLNVESSEFKKMPASTSVVLPPVQWNAMFLTYHACAHFVSEGLRLKQILDWAMFLNTHQNDVDWTAFYGFCERNHLKKFADAMTAIAVKYIGIKIINTTIVSESAYADKITHSALYDEDYVFGSGKGNWYNRLHLIRNMFHYRWKYEEIYQTSVWKQLWWYATGFIFKTE